MAAKGFIMMTALPPTYGHLALINFAKEYCRSAGIHELHVMVCSQPEEPYRYRAGDLAMDAGADMEVRWDDAPDLKTYGDRAGKLFIYGFHKTMPQSPEQDTLFWAKWQAEIFKTVGEFTSEDIVFSSETYGYPLARVLGCSHIIFDPARHVVKSKATRVRNEPIKYFRDMLPTAQSRFRKTVTIFGAESCGKTTLAKSLANLYDGQFAHYTPEWARPYLESLPTPETTDERMGVIVHGQRATEQAARGLKDKPFLVRDTDLLSTVGYYHIYRDAHSAPVPVVAVDTADLYIVCPSNIPFEPDPLRYGGTVRETTDQYWIRLLEDWGCNYYVLQSTSPAARLLEAEMEMKTLFMDHPLWGYERK